MQYLLMCLLSWHSTCAAPDEEPEALKRAEAARARDRIITARIEYMVRDGADDRGRPHLQFASWQCAHDRFIYTDRGDEEGVIARDESGAPLKEMRPVRWISFDEQLWRHEADALHVNVFPPEAWQDTLFDVRSIGLSPVRFGSASFDVECRKLGLAPSYDEAVEGGLHVVTARTSGGSVRWWIDPDKDWGVVRSAVWMGDRQIGETRIVLEQFDGVWFPARVERIRLGAGETEPSTVFEVLAAEFNRPEHPRQLTPNDIGVEVGTNIISPDGPAYWDGSAPVSFERLLQRLDSGEISMGLGFTREVRRRRIAQARGKEAAALAEPTPPRASPASQPATREADSEWRRYVRDFIARYQLDQEQARRAWDILADCESQAHTYMQSRRERIEEVDARIARGVPSEVAPAQREREKLLEPIARIFDSDLKPRLESIPTRRQRQTVPEPRP